MLTIILAVNESAYEYTHMFYCTYDFRFPIRYESGPILNWTTCNCYIFPLPICYRLKCCKLDTLYNLETLFLPFFPGNVVFSVLELKWTKSPADSNGKSCGNGWVSEKPRRLPRHQRAQAHISTQYRCQLSFMYWLCSKQNCLLRAYEHDFGNNYIITIV
jgi:hypothetical protein